MKTLLFAVLMLFSVSLQAQTILKYGGGSFSKEAVAGPISGTFLAPMGQLAYTPFSVQNSIATVSNVFNADFAYALVNGTTTGDNGSVDIAPNWFIGAFAGGGIYQNESVNLGHGVIGIDVGKPSLLGNIAIAGAYDLDTKVMSVGIATVFSFDLLNGLGVIQL